MVLNAGYPRSGWASLPALAVALAVGLFNGVLIAYVSMPSFVVTLGMLSIARSQGQVVSEQQEASTSSAPDGDTLLWLGGKSDVSAFPIRSSC